MSEKYNSNVSKQRLSLKQLGKAKQIIIGEPGPGLSNRKLNYGRGDIEYEETEEGQASEKNKSEESSDDVRQVTRKSAKQMKKLKTNREFLEA